MFQEGHVSIELNTFYKWYEKILLNKSEDKKIVVAIDNIDILEKASLSALNSFFYTQPDTIFALFGYPHTMEYFDVDVVIEIDVQDNIFFSITKDYLQALQKRFVGNSSDAQQIFDFFISHSEEALTVKEVAQKLGIYTPKVLQCITRMRPLLQVCKNYPSERCYRIFPSLVN